MKRFLRFTALLTLTAFVGLSAVETFHHHAARQTEAHCAICKVAHQTPGNIAMSATAAPRFISTFAYVVASPFTHVQFVFVSHGLSPPPVL